MNDKPINQPTRILFCVTCKTFTKHVLTRSQEHYVCGCGERVIYIINNAPKLWAVK